MKIHVRDGDELKIELPDGQIVSIGYEAIDSDSLPQLEIILPQAMTINVWTGETEKVGDMGGNQIVIPIEAPNDSTRLVGC